MAVRIGHHKISDRKTYLALMVMGLVWASMISVVGILNSRETQNKSTNANSSPTYSVTNLGAVRPGSYEGIAMFAKVTTVDIGAFTYKIHFVPTAHGSGLLGLRGALNRAVAITIATNTLNFEAGRTMSPFDLTLSISEGDSSSYPLDEFSDIFLTSATFANTTEPVNLITSLVAGIQSWTFTTAVSDNPAPTAGQSISVGFVRSATTRFFSVFVITCMWVLSLLVLTLSTSLWVRDRKVEPPTIAVATSMLFALPAVRAVQPGVPGIGCTADVIGFFWNVMMVAVSAALLLLNYIRKYKKEKVKNGGVRSGNGGGRGDFDGLLLQSGEKMGRFAATSTATSKDGRRMMSVDGYHGDDMRDQLSMRDQSSFLDGERTV